MHDPQLNDDAPWTEFLADIHRAVEQAQPTDSPEAQALGWRWLPQTIRQSGNDPRRAIELMTVPEAGGVTPAMARWIGEALAHARCSLFAKYLSPAQLDEVRRRQLARLADQVAWPTLVAELRAQMEAGTDPQAPQVQALMQRWQQLFRDSHCGDDPVLEGLAREAVMREPALRSGVGMDDALMTYLYQASVASQHMPTENAGPKPSAMMVAMQRAAHQLIERPLVLDDPLALAILGSAAVEEMRNDLESYRNPMAQGLRSAVVVRSRLAEDHWLEAAERGVRQYVVLGAGLDTSAYRHPEVPGRRFEVDLPATQAWKQARLREAGIATPESLSYVPVDFERISLAEGLARAGFDVERPAFFSWLGVTMYLEEAAVFETLRFITRCAKGSEVLLEYMLPMDSLPPMMRIAMQQMNARLAQGGEPWKTFFEPEALAARMAALGFSRSRTWTPDELNQRYLADRSDGMRITAAPGRLMHAVV
jgi:methyltransferase (TIGR00027 family)